MASQDGEDIQRAEKVCLKRKLTGPPRLLLGKTRSRSVTEDRAGAHTNRDTTETLKHPAPSESAAATVLTHAANMEEGAENEGSVRGRCEAAGEDDDIRNRKSNRRRWWRRFSAAVVCNRKQVKDPITGSAKQQSPASPEGAMQQTDAAVMNDAEGESQKVTERKRRVTVTTWKTFRRFLTSSTRTHEQRRESVEKDGDQTPLTIREKLQKFFTRGSKSRLSGVAMETVEDVSKREDMTKCEDVKKREDTPCSPGAQVDEPNELRGDVTVGSGQVVTVTAEMTQLTEEQAADEEQLVCDVTEEDVTDAGGSEMIHAEVDERPADTADAPPEDLPAEEDQLSAASSSSPPPPRASLHCDEETDDITSHAHQTNGPSIQIELVPPDDVSQEDEEEVEEEEENQNHHLLLILLNCNHSERELLQMARSLVRAALNAAVDQLTREQLSDSDCVLREPPGCRDHA